MNKRIIIAVLVAAVVILGGGIWYVVEKTRPQADRPDTASNGTVSDNEEDWQTYRNEELGFSMRHPTQWNVQEINGTTVAFTSPETAQAIQQGPKKTESPRGDVVVTVQRDVNVSLQEYVRQPRQEVVAETMRDITVNGLQGVEAIVGGVGADYTVFLKNEDMLYQITGEWVGAKDELTAIEQMVIGSFTLTGESVDMSDWQTYRSERGGFEFRLPRALKTSSLFFTDQTCVGELNVAEVPLKVFEDERGALVHRQYDYARDSQDACIQDEYTLAELRSTQATGGPLSGTWNIVSEPVRNDAELRSFVRKYFGSGCDIGERKPVDDLTYQVAVKSDGKDLGESQCPINYWLAVRYSPTLQRAAAWSIGQDCNFMSDEPYDGSIESVIGDRVVWDEQYVAQCADFGMTASFRFK